MRFEVETSARRRTINVRRSADGWTVTIDGRVMWADLAHMDDRWSLLLRQGDVAASPLSGATDQTELRGGSYEIAIESRERGRRLVHVDGRVVPVTLLTPGKGRSGSGSSAQATGPIEIVSPMPGRIVKVLVAPGQAVAARQGLVVVEAMKMENELRAPRAGTVADVRVREGAPVEASVVLVVLT